MHENPQLDALGALDRTLARHGIEYWLFGGWAVDFHAGAITRDHGDLDVAIWAADRGRVDALLAAEGWSHSPDPGEDGSTAYERGDVRLEVAFLARDEVGTVHTPLRDGRAEWAEGAFGDDVAELRGVRARVIALGPLEAEKSVAHDDAQAGAKDRADLDTLARLRPDR